MVKACAPALLKELPLQDADTACLGRKPGVPEPLHFPSEGATGRKGHKKMERHLVTVAHEAGDCWETEKACTSRDRWGSP